MSSVPLSHSARPALLILVVLTAGCGVQPTTSTTGQVSAAPADKQQLIAYGESRQYWTRFGAADRQLIDGKILATAEPEVNSFKLTKEELASGRIIGRFHKAPGGELRRFGLLDADTLSYWTVSMEDGRYMGRFVSESFDTTYAITVDWHDVPIKGAPASEPNLPWGQSIAQWRFTIPPGGGTPFALVEGSGSAWMTCSAFGCCRTN